MQATKISHKVRVTVMSAALLVLSGAGARQSGVMAAQQANPPVANPGANMPPGVRRLELPAEGPQPDPEVRARTERQREKALNDDRQRRLAGDVDRLVELANELKGDVDKANKDQLSLEVIKKAQEIEKLAHDVQSRMKS